MKFGITMFPTDYSIAPQELALEAEARGFESLWFPEHSHIPTNRKSPWPGGPDLPKWYFDTYDQFLALTAAAAVTKTIKLGTGVCLVVQRDPIYTAKEVATLDRISNGRFLFGVGGGWNAEEMADHGTTDFKGRFKLMRQRIEAMKEIWTKSKPKFDSELVKFDEMMQWPKPVQKPHPPIMIPIVGSQESIEFAGRHNIGITPGLAGGGLRDDIIRHYAKSLKAAGHRITPDHLSLALNAYVADSKAQAVKEVAPYHLYFNRTLFSHGSFTETAAQRQAGYVEQNSTDYVRPENQRAAALLREDFRNMSFESFQKQAENLPYGTASEVAERIIAQAEHAGANMVQIGLNRGAMPHEMFMEQIRRFAEGVLPRLQAHEVKRVRAAEEIAA